MNSRTKWVFADIALILATVLVGAYLDKDVSQALLAFIALKLAIN